MARSKRQHTEIITALDIGSTAIRIAVGQQIHDHTGIPELQIIGTVEVPSEGVHKGVVTSIEETVSSISNAIERIERHIGVPVEHVWVGISDNQIIAQESRGVIAVAKSGGEITLDDIERAVDAARTVAPPLNYEVLHVLPRNFSVDGQTGIRDPIGMTGIRLEVTTQMIYGVTSNVKNITKAVYRTGVDIDDVVLSVLAAGEVVTTQRQRDIGVVVVDIGGSTTSMVVYEHGDILHSAVLPIGSEHVTNDIAIGLRTAIDIAEHIKLQYGTCVSSRISKREKIRVTMENDTTEDVSKRFIAEIIEARVSEILTMVNKELFSIERRGLLPAGVVFTGGGAKIRQLVELSKDVLELPAMLGYPLEVQGITDGAQDLAFTPAVGLVKWGANVRKSGGKQKLISFKGKQMFDQVQKMFKSLIP